jgi:hypothetical protein
MFGANPHVVLIIGLLERAHDLTADQRSQRRGDVVHAQSELARLLAVDVDLHLGLAVRERGVHVGQTRIGPQPVDDLLGVLGELAPDRVRRRLEDRSPLRPPPPSAPMRCTADRTSG